MAEQLHEIDNRIQDQRLHRMSSITRKLHFQLFRKKLGIYIGLDLLITFVLSYGWFLEQELRVIGHIDFDYKRSFMGEGGFWDIYYVVRDGETELLRTKYSIALFMMIVIVGSLVVLEILLLLAAWHGETKKIRRTLQPINEIALRADAMSRLSFTDAIYGTEGGTAEESYHRLEEAIRELNPDQESMPSLGDQELQGIEAAMNNLLRRMHESYQQQARFVNDASHELRTPIAVIQGYVKMLDRWGREDPSVLNESITAISHEADHMHQLVEQLLFLARGDAGRTQLKQEPVELTAMMREIYEESLMIDEGHPYRFKVTGDPMLLKQSVRILLDNAAKYTKQGDDISLSVGLSENGEPYLQVQDSGVGMAEADVEHMFERFYRADETREIQGTGLGLAIAKWIVDRHKGHFEILSRTELGTRIRVVLPRESIISFDRAPKEKNTSESPEDVDAAERPDTESGSAAERKPDTESGSAAESENAEIKEKVEIPEEVGIAPDRE